MIRTRSVVLKERRDILSWTSQKLPPYMTRDEVRGVLEGAENKPFNHLLINFLWQTGRVKILILKYMYDINIIN